MSSFSAAIKPFEAKCQAGIKCMDILRYSGVIYIKKAVIGHCTRFGLLIMCFTGLRYQEQGSNKIHHQIMSWIPWSGPLSTEV